MEIILASTSPSRRTLMDSLRIPYRIEAPLVDEDVPEEMTPDEAVVMLAERKARAVFERFPEACVIGSDQLAVLDGQPLGKPSDRAMAKRQLQSMLGRSHFIATGLCVVSKTFFRSELDLSRIELYALSDEELERYLDLEEWRGCAGSYRVESAGQALFHSLEGDRTSVIGLPMLRLVKALRDAQVKFF